MQHYEVDAEKKEKKEDMEEDGDEDDEENACSKCPWQYGRVYLEGTHSPAGSGIF